MKSEFALAFNQICAEYDLPRDVVLEAVQAALVSAYRRDWKVPSTQNLTAEINMLDGSARVFIEKTVVADTVEDPQTEILLSKARRRQPNIQVGDTLMVDVTPRNFGRIAAQTAKQVIMQRLREAERESQFERFSRQEGEIIIGTVQSIRPHGITLHLDRKEEALMPRHEQIPGEHYTLHQKLRVYVLDVKRSARGPQITVSRSHPAMLRRQLELEVPEIRSGQVEIKAIAREAGSRSKVAVVGHQEGLDPVGACVGMRGIRIQTISRELNDERIDVVEWSEDPAQLIANALSLDGIVSVVLDEHAQTGRTASVVVLDDQLSLAIGRAGQNARLAAKMTGWRIDIQGITEAALGALRQINKSPDLLGNRKEIVGLIPRLASIIRSHEQDRYPYTDEEQRIIKTVIEAVQKALIERRNRTRPGTLQRDARTAAQRAAEEKRRAERERALATVPPAAYEAALDVLELPEKVRGHLTRNGLENVGEVMEKIALGNEALLMIDGIGAKALTQIKEAVEFSPFSFITPEAEAEAVEAAPEEALEVEEAEAVEAEAVETETIVEETVMEAAEAEEIVEEEVAAEPGSALPVSREELLEAGFDEETIAALEEAMAEEPAISFDKEAVARLREAMMTPQPAEEAPPAEEEEEETLQLKVPPKFAVYDEYEEEDEWEELEEPDGKKKRRRKKKPKRTILYDEETGETYTVRRRRQNRPYDLWEDYREH
ncbi:MAG: transcription termination factor NusA [Anaerolineae bacterium]